jgi:hypothetical protein
VPPVTTVRFPCNLPIVVTPPAFGHQGCRTRQPVA